MSSSLHFLQDKELFFILKDLREWRVLPTLALFCALLAANEFISHWTPYVLDYWFDAKRITPGGAILHRRVLKDYLIIAINKTVTAMFMVHFIRFVSSDCLHGFDGMTAKDWFLQVLLPIPLQTAVYDFFYSPFHRFLHWPPIYPFIHKHHHRFVAPHRGYDDAINTHPIEYLLGMYLHLLAPVLLVRLFHMPLHSMSPFLFLVMAGFLNTINHTRFSVRVPFFYDSREHDTHHRLQKYNYASYFSAWDMLYGTYKDWSDPPALKVRVGPPPPALAAPNSYGKDAPQRCVVTGGNGLVGSRLVAMLVERGAESVIAVDLGEPRDEVRCNDPRVKYVKADICDEAAMASIVEGATAVFHVAALVGPYFPQAAYERVNHLGSKSVADACLGSKSVRALVVTSSPSTRLDGTDVYNLREEELKVPRAGKYLQEYARSKAVGEAVALACNGRKTAGGHLLHVCAIAPHQVYGNADTLFLPSLLRAAASGQLRIMGAGDNLCSFTHVDNVCHAHILAAKALLKTEGARNVGGEFFVVTDGGAQYLWDVIDDAVVRCGLRSLHDMFHIEEFILYPIAHICLFLNKFKKVPFRISPFAVRMLTMQRYFNVEKIADKLGYRPIVAFETAWPAAADASKKRLESEGLKLGVGVEKKEI